MAYLHTLDDDDTPFSYQSHMDVSRFQQLLLAEQLKKQHEEQLQSQQINTHQLLKQAAHITQRHTKLGMQQSITCATACYFHTLF